MDSNPAAVRKIVILAAVGIAIQLCGCVTNGAPPPEVTQPVKIVCLPMPNYSQPDLDAFADQVAGLDPEKDKQVIRFLGDYKAMREANRACHDVP